MLLAFYSLFSINNILVHYKHCFKNRQTESAENFMTKFLMEFIKYICRYVHRTEYFLPQNNLALIKGESGEKFCRRRQDPRFTIVYTLQSTNTALYT